MDLDGVLVVDKPEGISSARALHRVKKATGAAKAGHAGTLDPFATGVLVCCLNRATRLARFFLGSNKRYRAVMTLGVETDTQDLTGNVVARHRVGRIGSDRIRAASAAFKGPLMQQPPVYSALKHQGVPLYRLAREGRPVQKPARKVEIRSIEVTAVDLPEVEIDVACSAGTYIRTLCADIGRRLGCGAHLAALRRTKSSGFSIEEALPLDRLEKEGGAETAAAQVVSMAAALRGMPSAEADRRLVGMLRQGRTIPPGALDGPEEGFFKVVDPEGRLVAVLRAGVDPGRYTYFGVFASD